MGNRPDSRGGRWLAALLLLLALLTGCSSSDSPAIPTDYTAVFLDNGQVFFGRLEKAGPAYLTLRDVFYVQTQVDQEKKQAKNILVKRGLEWHAPDFMQIHTRHVVLIEPVAPESQVAQLIHQFKKGPPPAAVPSAPAPPEPAAAKPKTGEPPPPAPAPAAPKPK